MTAAILEQLNLVVRDMDAALAFYRAAGVDIPDDAIWRTATGAHHATARMPGGIELALDSRALAETYNRGWREVSESGSRVVLTLRVASREDADRVHQKLCALGHRTLQPPYDTFWGARYVIMEDPDGNHVGFMSPSDPSRRSPPPDI